MFFSWFKTAGNTTVPSIKWWYNTSVVAHATSTTPGGNYTFVDIVLPPRGPAYFDGSTTHNPTVTQLQDGSYALFYIGLNCHNYSHHSNTSGPNAGQSNTNDNIAPPFSKRRQNLDVGCVLLPAPIGTLLLCTSVKVHRRRCRGAQPKHVSNPE